MVCVHMGLECKHQVQSKLPYQRDIPTRLLEDWIDDHRLSALAVAEEVGVGGGLWVEQLPEDQHRFSPSGCPRICRSTGSYFISDVVK